MSQSNTDGLRIALISLHGLVRAKDMELGRDADTGGQIKYVVELAKALGDLPEVSQVDLITRQVIDSRVSSDYAELEEPISERARIVRIPFGPKRYLRKELLWPYLDHFIEQAITYYRRAKSVPHIIHGHYADAGYAGAQLARIMATPFIFTGHSLGRVKKQRLLKNNQDEAKLEERYRFTNRIEAEEFALETASLVITSTAQEVSDQYELYDHYVPERMEIIPPGINFRNFAESENPGTEHPMRERTEAFLRDPAKPMVLTMARPDERKNLESLIHVFGQSEELRNAANLVLVMGNRDDLNELPSSQRKVLLNCISLIDLYELYGVVAYPKSHDSSDVPQIYRMAQESGGLFINPAFTEPFGLTLLEAAASGLPVVATNDGGPRDIIANCENGMLVDVFDHQAIERALLRTLTDREQWKTWSENGVRGVQEHYTWESHARKYLRDASEILGKFDDPVKPMARRPRRLPDFDRMVVSDIDNTLTGDDEALRAFIARMSEQGKDVGFGIATGRRFDQVMKLIEEMDLPRPDLLITSVGTEIRYGANLTRDNSWKNHIDFVWDREKIIEVFEDVDGLYMQDEVEQSDFKVSYRMDTEVAPKISSLRRTLRANGLRVKLVLSLGMFLDIIPTRAGTGLSLRHLAFKWGYSPEQILVAGDSGNDEEMLSGRMLAVVVGNYSTELEKLRNRPRIYFSEKSHAAGILDGIDYYNFFDHVTIPNDRIEE